DDAIEMLEEMFEAAEATAMVATLLAEIYEERGDDERLAATLEACLETATTRDEKLAIADVLLPLQETKLGRPDRAFMTLGVRFQLDPDERDKWPKLITLAAASEKEAELAELWRSSLAMEDAPGRPTSTAGVNHLRVALARFVRQRFGEFEEPLALLEAVLRDTDGPAQHPEILEELEALHTDRHDPEALVRVLLAASQAVLDGDVHRRKVLDACRILRTELARPAEALTHYQSLYAEDPSDETVADHIESTYTHMEQWQELAQWLQRHAKMLVSPDRAADAHLRLVLLRHDRLDDREASHAELRSLAEQEPTASRARAVLVEIARRPETEKHQRDTLLDWVEALSRDDGDTWALAHVFEARTVGLTTGDARATHFMGAAKLLVPSLPPPDDCDVARRGPKAFELAALALRDAPASDDALAWVDTLAPLLEAWQPFVEACEDAASRADEDRAAALFERSARAAEVELGDIDRAIQNWRSVLTLARDEAEDSSARALEELSRLFTAHERTDDRIDLLTLRAERALQLGLRLRLMRERAVLLESLERVDEAVAGLHRIITLSAGHSDKDVAVERDEAMARLETLLTDQGRSEAVVDLLVESADQAGDPEVAARWLVAAADIAETRLERPDDAAAIYERLLDVAPDDATGYEALDRLYRASSAWDDLALVLERRRGVQLAAGDEREAVDTLYKLGQLARNRLGDEERAVAAYAECVTLEPTFTAGLEALHAASTRDEYGDSAREALAVTYRISEQWEALRAILEERIAKADTLHGETDLHAELSVLCLDQLGDIEGAWKPALESFHSAETDEALLDRRPLLTRSGIAVGAHEVLLHAVLSASARMTDDVLRGQLLVEAGGDMSAAGSTDLDLELLWQAAVDADPTQEDAVARLESVLRDADRPADLAKLLAVREAMTDD
ncbi:MAG: hypothetical protein QF464_07315, partial [Myxococcota bacterium]|nr:hypothetical protein [Myxococcota bacterium]